MTLLEAWHANPTVRLREADRALSYAGHVLNDEHGDEIGHGSTLVDPMPLT